MMMRRATCAAPIASGQANSNSYYNPYRVLLDIYDAKKEYGKTLELLKGLQAIYPNDPGLKQRIAEVQAEIAQQPAKLDTAKEN